MGSMTRERREAFLAEPRIAVLALNEPNSGPLAVPVWYWYEPGGDLWFETQPESRKGRLLAVGTRVSLCVQETEAPLAYVSIEGPVIEIAEDDRELHEIPMAQRYLGEEEGLAYIEGLSTIQSDWKRYIVRPERWRTMDGVI